MYLAVRSAEGFLGFSVHGGSEQGGMPVVCLSAATAPTYVDDSPQLRDGDLILAVGDRLVSLSVLVPAKGGGLAKTVVLFYQIACSLLSSAVLSLPGGGIVSRASHQFNQTSGGRSHPRRPRHLRAIRRIGFPKAARLGGSPALQRQSPLDYESCGGG